MEATMNIEPAIDLTKSTSRESLRLNVEAELQIMEHRERVARRRSQGLADMAEVRVRVGFDYTPGVGWHTSDNLKPLTPVPEKPKPAVKQVDAPAIFTDVRTCESTVIEADGTISEGNALEHAPYRDFGGLVRQTFGPMTPTTGTPSSR